MSRLNLDKTTGFSPADSIMQTDLHPEGGSLGDQLFDDHLQKAYQSTDSLADRTNRTEDAGRHRSELSSSPLPATSNQAEAPNQENEDNLDHAANRNEASTSLATDESNSAENEESEKPETIKGENDAKETEDQQEDSLDMVLVSAAVASDVVEDSPQPTNGESQNENLSEAVPATPGVTKETPEKADIANALPAETAIENSISAEFIEGEQTVPPSTSTEEIKNEQPTEVDPRQASEQMPSEEKQHSALNTDASKASSASEQTEQVVLDPSSDTDLKGEVAKRKGAKRSEKVKQHTAKNTPATTMSSNNESKLETLLSPIQEAATQEKSAENTTQIANDSGNEGPKSGVSATSPTENIASILSHSKTEIRSQGTSTTSKEVQVNQTDRVRLVQRVARAFQSIASRGGSLRMRLHPAELGSLRLEITVRHGMLTAQVETETLSAKSLLLDNLPILRTRLATQDIRIDRFDVSYSGHDSGGSPEGPGDEHQSHNQTGRRNRNTDTESETERAVQSQTVPWSDDRSRLNIVI